MKHIKLYENFQNSGEVIFDWMPYESQEKNPIQSQIPQSLSINELESYVASAPSEVEKAGLFIAHIPNRSQGFERRIVTSFNPLKFNITTWDVRFKKQSEFDNVDPVDTGSLSKGSRLMSRFGGFDD